LANSCSNTVLRTTSGRMVRSDVQNSSTKKNEICRIMSRIMSRKDVPLNAKTELSRNNRNELTPVAYIDSYDDTNKNNKLQNDATIPQMSTTHEKQWTEISQIDQKYLKTTVMDGTIKNHLRRKLYFT